MQLKKIALPVLLFIAGSTFAQDTISASESFSKPQFKISYLDSIKATFKKDAMASCVDSLWMKELSNIDLYDNLSSDIKNINIDEKVDFELPTELLKARLKAMDAKSPFNIEYNQGLENIIKSFLKNRKKSYERLMAISEYYFPVFEEALAKQNVPLEIKYLAIVESALNPKAVSRVGATGLWQFMYQTGKQYNLNVDSYVDERSDPLKASAAAAQYMSNMYKIFGDWELVLASYNSGAGNVSKAIRRSGGQQNFWNIRKNLPQETQGYVPAFLATMYIYEYHKEHGIVPNRALIKHFETDTIMVKREMSFKQISDLLDVPVAQLQLLNPSYKMNVVPFYPNVNHFLRMPTAKIAAFVSNEEKVYAYIDHEENKRERPFVYKKRPRFERDSTLVASDETIFVRKNKTKFHTVRRGDNLSEIANKYNVAISDIKRWNRLKSNKAPLGRKLKIVTVERQEVAFHNKKEPKSNVTENIKSEVANNDAKNNKQQTTEVISSNSEYTVQKGDNLSSIAKKYNVSVSDLKTWNNIQDNNVKLDSKLIINNSNNGVASLKENTDLKNKSYYTVQKGDNLSKIAKKQGVTVAEIQEWNKLEDKNVFLGMKLLILNAENMPTKNDIVVRDKNDKSSKNSHYLVRKGDSLFKIAQKYPGITVSDIKKWNGISGNDLKPGMKLKING
ncbi:MAG: LysM peptidoglycan-binding domain-containing protein [Flavobacterium sp.]|nr:LysM peptidoglycan-binding domain-containing protein [Flavobacterium sp.]